MNNIALAYQSVLRPHAPRHPCVPLQPGVRLRPARRS
jgi:hypothetical protein